MIIYIAIYLSFIRIQYEFGSWAKMLVGDINNIFNGLQFIYAHL